MHKVQEEQIDWNNETPKLITCENNMTFWKLITEFAQKNKWFMVLYFSLLLLNPIRDVFLPHLLGILYERINKNKPLKLIIYLVAFIIVFLQVMSIVSDFIEVRLGPLLQKYIMDKIIFHVFGENAQNYKEADISTIISQIIQFPNTVHRFTHQVKFSLIPGIITLIGACGYLLYTDITLGIIFLMVFVLIIITFFVSLQKCKSMSISCEQETEHVFSRVDDILRNMSTILNSNMTNDEMTGLGNKYNYYKKSCEKSFKCSLFAKYIIVPLIVIFFMYQLFRSYNKFEKNELNSGQFVSSVVIGFVILNTVIGITAILKDVVYRWGVIKNSLSLFKECKMQRIPYREKPKVDKGISVQDLYFSRIENGKEFVIFNNLNVIFESGSITQLLGKIGSGKSTLLNLILGSQTPYKGEIFIDGKRVRDLKNTGEISKYVFYVPQTPILFNRTIYENVTFGKNISKEKVIEVLKDIGYFDFIKQFPDGIDSNVGIYGSKLSGGQKQIVWLIKLIFNDPKVVLLDEPTASIDEASKEDVRRLIRLISKNKTVLIVTHDKGLSESANITFRLQDGEIKSEKNE